MATKPKTKPEPTPKANLKITPKPTHKSDSKIAPTAAAQTTQASSVKENKAALKTKVAAKVAEISEPKATVKTSAKIASKTEPKPVSITVKTVIEPVKEVTPKAKPVSITDLKPVVKTVQKAASKAVGKSLTKTEPVPAPKTHKWHEIKILLEKMKEDILLEIEKSVKNGTDAIATNEPGGDIYDQASSERDRELGLLLGDREREKLHSVDEALLRIDENEYGICEECDEDIPLGRLKAMPFTRHCVKCKSDLEKLQAQTKRFEEDRAYREIPLGSEEEEA